jgi:hypothetical protein
MFSHSFFRIGRKERKIDVELESVQAKKYLNMMLLGYETSLTFLDQFLDSLHADFKQLMHKMPQQ